MKKHTKHWVELAEYDLETAVHLFRSQRWPYVIFMCHLSIEKLLKACISEFTDTIPPKIHDLNKLMEIGRISMPHISAEFVSKLSQQSIATRYPEDLKNYTRQDAQYYLRETKKVAQWLEQRLKSAA